MLKGLKARGLSKYFSVERAHRVPGGRPRPGEPPRTIIARIFNFRDRDVILQEARKAPAVKVDNATVNFFPDFTLQVQKQRRDFFQVKRLLREQGLKYAMLFPAKLRVAAGDKTNFFATPEEAWDWVKSRSTMDNKNTRLGRLRWSNNPAQNSEETGTVLPSMERPMPARSRRSSGGAGGEIIDWFDGVS